MPGSRGGLPKTNHPMGPRRLLLILPIALAVAAGAHQLRWGDEHLFGQSLHDWIVAALYAGLPGVGLVFLLRALCGARQFADGSVLAERLVALLPGGGRLLPTASMLSLLAGAMYVAIELTEDDGDRGFVLALAIIAVLAFATALALRWTLRILAGATLSFARRLMHAGEPLLPLPLRATRRPLTTHRDLARVRLGRAPPIA